jgi:hypothetical protein
MVTNDDRRRYYDEQFAAYRALFGSMDGSARSVWFFVADEGEILSFMVAPGESTTSASVRHGVKLAAMADALEACGGPGAVPGQVADLRRLAGQHGYRFD